MDSRPRLSGRAKLVYLHHRRQQQCRRGPARTEHSGRKRRSHRLSGRARRNRRFLPHPRCDVEIQCHSSRSGHYQSHANRRLRKAINEKTKLLLRVHRSNFQITGFTEQPSIAELAELARKRNMPLMEDLGSGALFDLRSIGVNDEPSVLDSLEAGVDVVTYSGDKLLGGPQAGILSGRSDLIARMRANSLFRAFRVDKLTYAALEATLLAYVKGDHDAIPALRMMRLSKEEIGSRAETIVAKIRSGNLNIEIVDGESVIGGGAAPSAALPTKLLAITSAKFSADEISTACGDPSPIIARVEEGRVLLDLRTVFPEQDGTDPSPLQ